MSEEQDEYIVKSCEPKSDQLNADDLVAGPRTFTITAVKRGDAQQPVWISIEGAKEYKPSKGMRRVLVAAWGEHPRDWIGQRIELYRDESILFGGVRVGGLRISALSGIKEDMTFLVTVSKGKRSDYKVKRLDDEKPVPSSITMTLTEAEQSYVTDCKKEIASAESLEALTMISKGLGKKSDAVKNIMRPIYAARKAELTPPPESE